MLCFANLLIDNSTKNANTPPQQARLTLLLVNGLFQSVSQPLAVLLCLTSFPSTHPFLPHPPSVKVKPESSEVARQ